MSSQSAFAKEGGSSSSEANNPFNEFTSPSGGIDLFSGQVAFIHPLFTLSGRNGMDLALEMSYSSNVHLNVVARNEKAPTDWVGLGWRMNYGSVRCETNQTVRLSVNISASQASNQIMRAQGNIGSLSGRVTVLTSEGAVTF